MEKVLKMAEGIDIGETRSYELVPGRKLKRYRSPSDSEYICRVSEPSLSLFGDSPGSMASVCHGATSGTASTANWREVLVVCPAGLQSSSPSCAVCVIHTQFCLCLRKYHFSFQLSGNWFPLGMVSGIKYLSGFVCCGEV